MAGFRIYILFSWVVLLLSQPAAAEFLGRPACENDFVASPSQRIGEAAATWKLINERSRALQKDILDNPMAAKVAEILNRIASQTADISNVELDGERKIVLRFVAKGEALQLVRVEASGAESLLLDQRNFPPNSDPALFSLSLAPNQKNLAIVYSSKGSIDDFSVMILDLTTGVIKVSGIKTSSQDVGWLTDSRFIIDSYESTTGYGLATFDLNDSGRRRYAINGSVFSVDKGVVHLRRGRQYILVVDGHEYELPENSVLSDPSVLIIGKSDTEVYFRTKKNTWGNGQVVALTLKSLQEKEIETRVVLAENGARIRRARFEFGKLVVSKSMANHANLTIYDEKGSVITSIPTPESANVVGWKFKEKGEVLVIKYQTYVQKKLEVEYRFANKRFNQNPSVATLKSATGDRFQTQTISITAKDGMKVPVRIFSQKENSLTPGSPRPILLDVYGGFDSEGEYTPRFDPMYEEYLKRGGVLVMPALRGGGENGIVWNQGGRRENKPYTITDVHTVLEYFIISRMTEPGLVSIMGTSNGGFTVAASALSRPDLIGLAVPINGTIDYRNLKQLDPRFDGWTYEMGDADNEKDIVRRMEPYIPLDVLKQKPHGNLLVITGLNDSRVNPEHSRRLVEQAMASGSDQGFCHWCTIENGGHWVMSSATQPQLYFKGQLALWTAIFLQSGFRLSPEKPH